MFTALLLLVLFFLAGLVVRYLFSKDLCALCLAVSITWIYLFYEYWFQGGDDSLILGILLGGSAVGGLYYLFSKIPERYQIFKFPYLISAFWAIYQLLSFSYIPPEEVALLAVVWVVFFVIFIFYTNQKWQALGKKIIECCKNW